MFLVGFIEKYTDINNKTEYLWIWPWNSKDDIFYQKVQRI